MLVLAVHGKEPYSQAIPCNRNFRVLPSGVFFLRVPITSPCKAFAWAKFLHVLCHKEQVTPWKWGWGVSHNIAHISISDLWHYKPCKILNQLLLKIPWGPLMKLLSNSRARKEWSGQDGQGKAGTEILRGTSSDVHCFTEMSQATLQKICQTWMTKGCRHFGLAWVELGCPIREL